MRTEKIRPHRYCLTQIKTYLKWFAGSWLNERAKPTPTQNTSKTLTKPILLRIRSNLYVKKTLRCLTRREACAMISASLSCYINAYISNTALTTFNMYADICSSMNKRCLYINNMLPGFNLCIEHTRECIQNLIDKVTSKFLGCFFFF